jgi:hypothetical protein
MTGAFITLFVTVILCCWLMLIFFSNKNADVAIQGGILISLDRSLDRHIFCYNPSLTFVHFNHFVIVLLTP